MVNRGKIDAGVSNPTKSAESASDGDRLEQILDVATRHINEFGLSEASFRDIAKSLGLTRASLYYYVRSRSDLVFQISERSLGITLAALEAAHSPDRPALEVLRVFLAEVLDPKVPEISVMAEIGLLEKSQRERIDQLEQELLVKLQFILSSGIDSGELRKFDCYAVSRTIISVMRSVPHVSYWGLALNNKDSDRHAFIKSISELLSLGWVAERSASRECHPVDIASLRTPRPSAFDKKALGEARVALIVTMASKIFNRRGIDSTSMDEIARETSTTKPTIYRLIGKKDDLLLKCYERTIVINRYIINKSMLTCASKSEALFKILVSIAFTLQDDELESIRPQVGYFSLSDRLRDLLAENDNKLMGFLVKTFTKMEAEDDIQSIDFNHLSAIIMGAMAWLITRGSENDLQKREFIASEATNVLRLGLRAI